MKQLRLLMENSIRAYHKNMPMAVVSNMDWIILLRWIHPTERADYASKLYKADELTKQQALEFIKFV